MSRLQQIKKILVISLSNIGDIILTFPVVDILKRDFPTARLDLVLGPHGEGLVKDNPALGRIFVYRKKQSFPILFSWIKELAAEQYDLVVDLRNTAIPFLIFSKQRTPLMIGRPKVTHMRHQHLARLFSIYPYLQPPSHLFSIHFSNADKERVNRSLLGLKNRSRFAVFAPGSRADNKRWREDGFAALADHLHIHFALDIVLIGDETDQKITAAITARMKTKALELSGQLTLSQSGYLLSLARLAIVNDSAPMHLASYLNIPVAAFFGPTDPVKYGPWNEDSIVIQPAISAGDGLAGKTQGRGDITMITNEQAFARIDPWVNKVLNG